MKPQEIATYLTEDVLSAIAEAIEAIGDNHDTNHIPSGAEIAFMFEASIAPYIEPHDEWFDEVFWPAYNYKVGKGAARKVASKLSPTMRQEIMDSLPGYERWLANTGTSKKHASTYLNPKLKHWQDFLPSKRERWHIKVCEWVLEYFRDNWQNENYIPPSIHMLVNKSMAIEDVYGAFNPFDVQNIAIWMVEGWSNNPEIIRHIKPQNIFNQQKWPKYKMLAASFADQKNQQEHGAVHLQG